VTVHSLITTWKPWMMPKEPLKKLTDDALMARIARRDESAFTELTRRFLKWAYRFDFRFLGNRAAAEDAVQEKFLRIWQRSDQYQPQPGSRLSNYLLKIDKNICLDMLRKADRRREIPVPGNGADFSGEVELLEYLEYCHRRDDLPPGSGEVQHQSVELAERVYRYTQDEFSPRQFLVFWGFISGMSYREIAAAYDLGEGSVRGLIARGFSRIRAEFGGERRD